jgi:cytochrome c2
MIDDEWRQDDSRGRRRRAARALLAIAAIGAATGCAPSATNAALGGDPEAGSVAITRRACGSCHNIPGIQDADGRVGPSLAGFGAQRMIAGRLANRLDTLFLYLKHPQAVVPGNEMPDQGLSDREARDIAAYLESLR